MFIRLVALPVGARFCVMEMWNTEQKKKIFSPYFSSAACRQLSVLTGLNVVTIYTGEKLPVVGEMKNVTKWMIMMEETCEWAAQSAVER